MTDRRIAFANAGLLALLASFAVTPFAFAEDQETCKPKKKEESA